MKPRNSIKNKTTKVDWRMSREVKSYDNKNNNKIKRKERTQSNESKMSYNVKIENNDAKGEDDHNDPRPSSSPSNIASSDYTSDSKPTTSPTKKRRLIPGIISNGHNEEGKERKAKLPHHDNHNNCQRVHSRSLLLGTLASDMIPLSNILYGHDIIQYHSPQRHKKCPVNIYTGYGMLSGSYAVLSSIETNGVAPRQLFRSMMQGFPPFDHSNDNKRDDISQQTERVNDSNTLFQEYHSNIASNNKISGRVLQYPFASADYTSDSKPTTSPTKKRRLIPGIISNGHNEEGKERKAKLPHHDNHNNCQRVHSRSLLLGTLASDMIPLSNILYGHDIIQYHSPQRHKKCPVNIYTGYGMLSGSYAVLSSIETNGVAPRQLFRSMMQGFPPFDHSNDNKRDDISQQTERVNDSNTLFQEYHSNIASNNKISGRVLQYPTLQHYESLSSNNFDADRTSHHNEVERRSSQHQDHEDSNYIDSDNTIQRYYADLSETDIDGLLDTDEFHILCLSPNSINSSNT